MSHANHTSQASRRLFLRHAGAMSALLGGAAPVALNLSAIGSAAAQTVGDYKAIVCLFFYGGNDAYNMVLPTDSESWAAYTTTRNQAPDSIALLAPGTPANAAAAVASPARLGGVLPLLQARTQPRPLALHPLLGSLRTLHDSDRRLAILPNIGPLVQPLTKAEYVAGIVPRPPRLFSHNDQQNTWQALAPEGARTGWAGRMGDLVAAQNGLPVFTAISASGNAVWLSGDTVQQYQVNTTGAIALGVNTAGQVFGSADVGATLQRMASTAGGSSGTRRPHPFDADLAAVARRSIDAEALLRTALRPASDAAFGTAPVSGTYNVANDPKLQYLNPLNNTLTANALAQQFQVVARLIDAGLRGVTQARRQVFFVSLGGFDTHDLQNRSHADLYARVGQAMKYFDDALGALNARNNVVTFTASDFGRTFTSNGDGTDHGWGSHHVVMGGAVRGGQVFGRVPVLAVKNANNSNFDGSPDQLTNGSMLPQTSVDQLGYTLGTWFGLSPGDLGDIFPNSANFDASVRNLGFMV
jgi:uncharacterized protein (DUF1501 family)